MTMPKAESVDESITLLRKFTDDSPGATKALCVLVGALSCALEDITTLVGEITNQPIEEGTPQ